MWMINGNPVNNGSLIHTQTHTHIHIYNLMLNAQNNMIIYVIVFLVRTFKKTSVKMNKKIFRHLQFKRKYS